MAQQNKDQDAILKKLGIEALNPMQLEAHAAIFSHEEVILLSPTGTGKTLAFLLPLLNDLDPTLEQVQALILAPSRELAIQIEQVAREMGSGYKVNAIYGGRANSKDKIDLKQPPAILIGTPGRIADHFRRGTVSTDYIKTLILDEFDKSLEVGFEKEMKEIVFKIPNVEKKILTSATQQVEVPTFLGLQQPKKLNFLKEGRLNLKLRTILTPKIDKLSGLEQLLRHLGDGRGIIFCNFKDTIQFVSDFLTEKNIAHARFYGGLEQRDRERALIRFRNGTHRILLATDLAARGIDVPALDFIIHYQVPFKLEEFVHRNGRTARMQEDGTAYILLFQEHTLADFIEGAKIIDLPEDQPLPPASPWETLFISGGRKDKISKGDIAGLFFKQGELEKGELGVIELKQDCAFVAVPRKKVQSLVKTLNNSRLKKKKVRITLMEE